MQHEDIVKSKMKNSLSDVRKALDLVLSHGEPDYQDSIYRGQTNCLWDFTPSLYRKPYNEKILDLRKSYTQAFIEDLRTEFKDQYDLDKLSQIQLQAVAQHYGFYTTLLDFTYDSDIAAFFATYSPPDHATHGLILRISTTEHAREKEEWGEGLLDASGFLSIVPKHEKEKYLSKFRKNTFTSRNKTCS